MKGCALAVAASVCLASVASSQNDPDVSRLNDVFRGEKDAYALWPAQYVAGPKVLWANWSPSGKRILGCRQDRKLTEELVMLELLGMPIDPSAMPGEELFAWSADTGKVTSLGLSPGSLAENVSWIGRSDTALTTLTTAASNPDGSPSVNEELLSIDLSTGRTAVLTQAVSNKAIVAYMGVECDLATPYALVFGSSFASGSGGIRERREVLWVVRPGGKMGPPIELPPGPIVYRAYRSAAKHATYLCGIMPKRPDQPKRLESWYVLDDAGAALKAAAEPADAIGFNEDMIVPGQGALSASAAPPKMDVEIRYDKLGQGNVLRRVESAWVTASGGPPTKGRRSTVLVAADCTRAMLSPTMDRVLYVSGGSLFRRNIQRIDLEEYERIAEKADRDSAMNQAKQVALSLIMYAADNDDNLPAGMPNDLEPYIKDTSLLDGFVYTFQGGSFQGVESPAATEMGHIDGIGGRAVAYMDGHVKWIKN